MQKKIIISNKIQNILLGSFIFMFCATVLANYFKDIEVVDANITNSEIETLDKKLGNVEPSIARHINALFTSIGEIYYEDDIKKASLTVGTNLFRTYQAKAHAALRKFILFKDFKNAVLFDDSYNIITSLNRTIMLDAEDIRLLKAKLEDYQRKQVIFQEIAGKKVAIFLLKLNYSQSNSAYIVLIEDLSIITNLMLDYENESNELFLFSKTLNYQNSFVKLKGHQSYNYYNLQHDTLLKFNPSFKRSYNANGEETISSVKSVSGFQNLSVLGLLKPNNIAEKINNKKSMIKDHYMDYLLKVFIIILIYGLIVYFKLNIQEQALKLKNIINNLLSKLKKQHYELEKEVKELTKQAQKDAYSYIDSDPGLKNSVYKVYNSLKKMTPEDIRSLSIKNSLSKENIRLMYQPVIDSKNLQPQFCEVFLRLLNYYGEELMPSEFIPVLSHFNMLENLDEMMLEKVIKKVQSLQNSSSDAKISLNISNGAFNSEKFLFKLKESLIKGNINTSNVILEIPDLSILDDDKNSDFIQDLNGYGVDFILSIDILDIETLKIIEDNKIKYLRIDMSKFSDVLDNKEKQKVLKEIISNAKKHNLTLIAERIETEFMFKLAKSLDINFLQGYYISKPKKYYTHK